MENEVVYKEVRIDHSKPANTSAILKANGFNIDKPIHSRNEFATNYTVYSQAEGDLLCTK